MPRENNPNILLKARKLLAKPDEPLQLLPPSLPLLLPLAKPTLPTPLQFQFQPETPLSQPPLQSNMKSSEWSAQDEVTLSKLHNQLGNRWSLISRTFAGKSDNCVKNHFFSRLRMSLRHLNKQLPAHSIVKPVKMHVLYKIMATCQERFNPDSEYTQLFIDFSYQLKNKILDFLIRKNAPTTTEIEKIVADMHLFNRQFKMRAEVLKIPKAARMVKAKKQKEDVEKEEEDDSINSILPSGDSGEAKLSDAPSWSNLEAILEDGLRLCEMLQLKQQRVQIRMVDTSEYLFNEEEPISKCLPQFEDPLREPAWCPFF